VTLEKPPTRQLVATQSIHVPYRLLAPATMVTGTICQSLEVNADVYIWQYMISRVRRNPVLAEDDLVQYGESASSVLNLSHQSAAFGATYEQGFF